MAGMAAEAGFNGLDLTVRPGGHVLPERVADDLPRAVEAARKAGISIPTIVTALTSADSPQAEAIIRTAAGQGVQAYRTGWINYQPNETIEQGMERSRQALTGLAALNQKHRIHGAYQNHHGTSLGAPVWDLAEVLKGQDARYMGCQYDLYHATIEGVDSWPLGFRRIHPYVQTLDVKDFRWAGTGKKVHPETVPLGEGMVDFPRLFQLVKQLNIQPLLSMHFEYPMPTAVGGADARRQLIALMKKDLNVLQGWLQTAGLGS
jgi:sugar phosphate isomerase/epimerase